MSKFTSPLGKELWITQTYHTGGNNTAIDLSANADVPVYALADGIVTYRSSGAGSYCIQTVTDSTLKIYYVHSYRWVGANTFVKKGDVVCYIAPTSLNGGYPTHLHLGLQTGKEIMDYFDRSIVFRTKYADIKKEWFIGENINWALFKDLSYNNIMSDFKVGDKIVFTGVQNIRKGSGIKYEITGQTTVGQIGDIIDGVRVADGYNWFDIKFAGGGTGWIADVGKMEVYTPPVQPPVMPPEQTECEKQVNGLKAQVQELEAEINKLNDTVKERGATIKKLEGELEQKVVEFSELSEEYQNLEEKNKMLEEERLLLQEKQDKELKAYRRWDWLISFLNAIIPTKK